MKKIKLIICLFFVYPVFSFGLDKKVESDHKHAESSAESLKEGALIKVKGMVCDFCAQGIEKKLMKTKKVESAQVSLEKMEVLVKFKKGKKLSNKKLKKIITSAGFSVGEIK